MQGAQQGDAEKVLRRCTKKRPTALCSPKKNRTSVESDLLHKAVEIRARTRPFPGRR